MNSALLIRKTEFAVHPRTNFECFIEWKGFVDLRRILDQIRQKPVIITLGRVNQPFGAMGTERQRHGKNPGNSREFPGELTRMNHRRAELG